jgi:alpha-glucosidase (family GH31 glycosyl hydrolase)
MWLAYPGDAEMLPIDDAYLWGDALLVAPVIAAGARERVVRLPAGAWYDYWTQERLQGGREIAAAADLSTLPLYVKAGSIVPLGPVKQFATEKVDAPLDVYVYPGADGRFSLYEDDGVSMDHTRGVFSLIEMVWHDASRSLSLKLAEATRMHSFTTRSLVLHLVGGPQAKTVTFDGTPLQHTF